MIPREKTTLTKWDTPGEKVFYAVNAAALSLLMIACIYPILCIISGAISDPAAVSNGRVTFYPIGFSLEGFRLVLKDNALITGFLNTVFYTVVGTVLNVFVTVITAYSLSRRELIGRGVISFFFAFTMWFSGGIIPFYLLVKQLGMMNTRWALIIPGLMSVWSMIVCRTFIASTIPEDIFEASSIDGCGYFRYFFLMVLPLSKAILAVLSLWYAIGHWNEYFHALIFVYDKKLQPFSLFLRSYLVLQETMDIADIEANSATLGLTELMKNALILMSCLPLWLFYPFMQKFLVKGVMIGSVKG